MQTGPGRLREEPLKSAEGKVMQKSDLGAGEGGLGADSETLFEVGSSSAALETL